MGFLFALPSQTRIWSLLVSVAAMGFLVGIRPDAMADSLRINEVMSSNHTTLQDEDGEYPDWIELYNPTSEVVSLAGWGVSDDEANPRKWVFTGGEITTGGLIVVFASGKDRPNRVPPHTNFSIASEGEPLILTDPSGRIVDFVEERAIPRDVSWGRKPDGGPDWFYFDAATPGTSNTTEAYVDILPPPSFSHSGGFYTDSFDLSLHHDDPEVVILYSDDGSVPRQEDLTGRTYGHKIQYPDKPGDPFGELFDVTLQTLSYESPLRIENRAEAPDRVTERHSTSGASNEGYKPLSPVFKGRVVRARAFREGYLPSPTETHTFFVAPEGRQRYSMAVFAVTVEEDRFFDYDEGIYVAGVDFDTWRAANPTFPNGRWWPANYNRRGDLWEYPAHIEYFEEAPHAVYSQNIGVRIHGGQTRAVGQKTLRLYARSQYDSRSSFEYDFFPGLKDVKGNPIREFERLLLRNSGNDWDHWTSRGTMFRDAFMQRLAGFAGFDTMAYRPTVVFLNGEYWGIHNLRERYDQYYIESKYGVDPEDLVLLEGDALIVHGRNGDDSHFRHMTAYLSVMDMTNPQHYDYIRTQMDIDNFISYQIAQIFFNNEDWPASNIMFWRKRTERYEPDAPYGHDGRWRWMMFDTDFGFGLAGGVEPYEVNTLEFATNPEWSGLVLRRLLTNETFRHEFLNRFATHLNTQYAPSHVLGILEEMRSVVYPEIADHIHRWRALGTWVSTWEDSVEVMRTFAVERPYPMRQHLVDFFSLDGVADVVLRTDPVRGTLRVHTVRIDEVPPGLDENGEWSGVYFQNVPLEIEAVPRHEFRFAGWTGDIQSTKTLLHVVLSGDLDLEAHFEIDEAYPWDEFGPAPHKLHREPWHFSNWPLDSPATTYPPNMVFLQTDTKDPALDEPKEDPWMLPYDLESRSRIVGLGDGGFAFLNTGNPQENGGGYLGAAVLALDTRDCEAVAVSWRATTVLANEREYAIRLRWRSGLDAPFEDVLDDEGHPVEYVRHPVSGHSRTLGPVRLPEAALHQPYVQLEWNYYATGGGADSGPRAKLAIGDVHVQAFELNSTTWVVH